MADKLHFSLVSPERELFSGDVDQVDAPGSEGMFGVLPNHAPFMSTLKPGAVTVYDNDDETRIFVRGGFADITPQGLTILAEEAIDLHEVKADEVSSKLKDTREDLEAAEDAHEKARLEEMAAYLEALLAAVSS